LNNLYVAPLELFDIRNINFYKYFAPLEQFLKLKIGTVRIYLG
jgi:hypothetical protein